MQAPLLKTAIATAMVLSAATAQAFGEPIVLTPSDVQVQLGATGNPSLQLELYTEFPLVSAQLELHWSPAALGFVPAQSGVAGIDLGGQTSGTLTPGSLLLSFNPPTPVDISYGAFDLHFAFVGQQLGVQSVSYSLTLNDDLGGRYGFADNLHVAVVPEPRTYALMLSGLALMAAIGRRRMNSRR
jgi:hypothetical protein